MGNIGRNSCRLDRACAPTGQHVLPYCAAWDGFPGRAEYGKLYGVSVISTVVNDLNKETVQHLYYDNIVFRVTP